MKKTYETPSAEIVKFQYRDQVVVASGGGRCITDWINNMRFVDNCQSIVVQESQHE